jgi:Peptidase M50B-like
VLEVLVAAARDPRPVVVPVGPPSHAMAFSALAVALLLVLGLWEIAGHADTIAHEGAHAVGMILFERGVRGVEIDYEGGQHTGATYRAGDFFSVLATILGYYGPPLFGLLGAALLVHGSATGVLWVFLLLLGGLLLLVRNLFGFLIVGATGALFYLTLTYGSAQAQLLVACTWVWLLLISGLVTALEHFGGGGDYRILRSATLIPGFVWATLSVLVAAAALWYGGSWLLGFSRP